MNVNDCKKYEPIFNSWYVKRFIGQGSFGTVFEIQREEFGKTYSAALKLISIPQSDEEIKQMKLEGASDESIKRYYDNVVRDIVSELVIMSELKGNSNIVSYEDHTVIKHEDDIGYDILIRMELLTPLITYRASHGITEKDVAKLGIDICKALELCEKNNIIHRDVKPENIFVSKNGDFKLGDFGIARTIEKTTSELSRKGTYTYMAPEIYRGDVYGQSVDIYSLGIVMYSMLNGNRAPFLPPMPQEITHNEKENALMRRIKGERIPAINGVSGRLMQTILKACSFNKGARYQSASEMREDLEVAIKYLNESQEDKTEMLGETVLTDLQMERTEDFSDRTPEDEDITEILGVQQSQFFDTSSSVTSSVGVYNPTGGTHGTDNNSGNTQRTIPDDTDQTSDTEKKSKRNKILIVILSVILALLVVAGIMLIKSQHSDGTGGETINAADITITDWDWDFTDSYEPNSNGTCNIDIIMTVKNNSTEDITGIAFQPKNKTDAKVVNKSPYYIEEAPFYAEGYISAGSSGVMTGNITINEEEYLLDHDGSRPALRGDEIVRVYPYRGEEGYMQATGRILKKSGTDNDFYDVEITNSNSFAIHEGSKIVAIETNNSGSIKSSSAQGKVDRIIGAGETVTILKAFIDPGLTHNKDNYKLIVIDNEYGDGSHYRDEYEAEYAY